MPENADIDLKKRARRRLVGAIALVLLAALILPSLMDSEPAIPAGELNISIPDMPPPPEEPLATARAPEAAAAPQSAESAGAITPPAAPADAAAQQTPQQEEEAMPLPASVSASTEGELQPLPPLAQQTPPAAATPEPSAPAAPVKEETPKAEKPAAQKAKPAASKAEADKAERERAEAALAGRKPEAKPAAAPKADSSGKRYLVQVAAVSNAEKAKGIVATLRKNGFNAYTEKAGELTRIRVSGYNSREAAEQAAEKIRNLKSDVKFSPTVQSQ
ncbi:MAG: SPOR domain-containing protein [Rhodocyclaceae bacterium]|nr:SPOR domain-containing protein [Rhodocyclaceae bacterium]